MSNTADAAESPRSVASMKVAQNPGIIRIQGHKRAAYSHLLIWAYVLFAPLAAFGYLSEATYGVIWATALMTVLLVYMEDFNRNGFAALLLVLGFLYLGADKAGTWLGISLLSNISAWFAGLNIPHPRDLALLVAIGCAIAIVWDKFRSRLNDYWKIDGNQIDHVIEGQSETSFPCLNSTVTTSYPNILGLIVLLAGDIVFRNPTEKEPRVIKNVPLCPWVAARVRRHLEAINVVDHSRRG